MSHLKLVVTHAPSSQKNSGGTLTNVTDVTIQRSKDNKKNVANIRLRAITNKIVNKEGLLKFQADDTIKIFAKYSKTKEEINTSLSTDLLFVGLIEEISTTRNAMGEGVLEIRCVDYTSKLVNRVISRKIVAENSSDAIKELIRAVSIDEKGSGFLVNSTEFVASTRSNGDSFPPQQINKTGLPFGEWVDIWSGIEYTNSLTEQENNTLVDKRKYIWWLDEDNKFHWTYPDDTSDIIYQAGLEEGETGISGTISGAVYRNNLRNAVGDIVNYVTIYCGKDLNDNDIYTYYYDPFTKSGIQKDTTRNLPKIAENIKAANPSISNADLRAEARRQGKERGRSLINGSGNNVWQGSITVQGEKASVGDLINFTDLSFGQLEVLLRIEDVTHSITNQQWTTTFSVKEDEKEVT